MSFFIETEEGKESWQISGRGAEGFKKVLKFLGLTNLAEETFDSGMWIGFLSIADEEESELVRNEIANTMLRACVLIRAEKLPYYFKTWFYEPKAKSIFLELEEMLRTYFKK